jgi:mercuric ion transport protein
MQTATKQLWASVLAAIVGSLCCVAPFVLLTLGISGVWIRQLTALEPYRPIFIGVMLVFIGLAFRQLYIVPARCAPGESCANPRLQRRQRQIFWVVVVGLAALIAFPWYAPLLIGYRRIVMRLITHTLSLVGLIAAGAASAAPQQTTTLAVENMTCGTCPIVVKKALERVPGVTSTSVDFDKKTATVTFDPDRRPQRN